MPESFGASFVGAYTAAQQARRQSELDKQNKIQQAVENAFRQHAQEQEQQRIQQEGEAIKLRGQYEMEQLQRLRDADKARVTLAMDRLDQLRGRLSFDKWKEVQRNKDRYARELRAGGVSDEQAEARAAERAATQYEEEEMALKDGGGPSAVQTIPDVQKFGERGISPTKPGSPVDVGQAMTRAFGGTLQDSSSIPITHTANIGILPKVLEALNAKKAAIQHSGASTDYLKAETDQIHALMAEKMAYGTLRNKYLEGREKREAERQKIMLPLQAEAAKLGIAGKTLSNQQAALKLDIDRSLLPVQLAIEKIKLDKARNPVDAIKKAATQRAGLTNLQRTYRSDFDNADKHVKDLSSSQAKLLEKIDQGLYLRKTGKITDEQTAVMEGALQEHAERNHMLKEYETERETAREGLSKVQNLLNTLNGVDQFYATPGGKLKANRPGIPAGAQIKASGPPDDETRRKLNESEKRNTKKQPTTPLGSRKKKPVISGEGWSLTPK